MLREKATRNTASTESSSAVVMTSAPKFPRQFQIPRQPRLVLNWHASRRFNVEHNPRCVQTAGLSTMLRWLLSATGSLFFDGLDQSTRLDGFAQRVGFDPQFLGHRIAPVPLLH